MQNVTSQKNKRSGLTEIIMSVLIFAGLTFASKLMGNSINSDYPVFSSIFYFVYYMFAPLLFIVGLTKMFKKDIKSNGNMAEPVKKQNPFWVSMSVILILVGGGFYIADMGECTKSDGQVFCNFGTAFFTPVFIGVGLFILFIIGLKYFFRNK